MASLNIVRITFCAPDEIALLPGKGVSYYNFGCFAALNIAPDSGQKGRYRPSRDSEYRPQQSLTFSIYIFDSVQIR